MKWFRKSAEPIGIDVGATGARMVQLRIEGETPKVISATRCRWDDAILAKVEKGHTPSPGLIGSQLNRMASQGQFQGREMVIAVPRELLQTKNFRLPTMPPDELIAAAEHEARAVFGVTEDEAIIRGLPAGEVRQGAEARQEVIAVCAKRDALDALVEQWHEIGFLPVGFDFDVAAHFRGVERFIRRRDDELEVNVTLEIDSRRSLLIVGRGRELNFCKSFDLGGAMLNNAIARKLGVSHADAVTLRRRLSDTNDQAIEIGNDPVRQAVIDSIRPIVDDIAREASLCLRYYSINFRGQRPTRVRVVGSESSDRSVLSLLSKAIPIPVEAGRMIANADMSQMKLADRTEGLGEWSLAFGLSLKFTTGTFPDRIGSSRSVVRPTALANSPESPAPRNAEPKVELEASDIRPEDVHA